MLIDSTGAYHRPVSVCGCGTPAASQGGLSPQGAALAAQTRHPMRRCASPCTHDAGAHPGCLQACQGRPVPSTEREGLVLARGSSSCQWALEGIALTALCALHTCLPSVSIGPAKREADWWTAERAWGCEADWQPRVPKDLDLSDAPAAAPAASDRCRAWPSLCARLAPAPVLHLLGPRSVHTHHRRACRFVVGPADCGRLCGSERDWGPRRHADNRCSSSCSRVEAPMCCLRVRMQQRQQQRWRRQQQRQLWRQAAAVAGAAAEHKALGPACLASHAVATPSQPACAAPPRWPPPRAGRRPCLCSMRSVMFAPAGGPACQPQS